MIPRRIVFTTLGVIQSRALFPREFRSRASALQALVTVPLFVWLYGWQRIDLVEWRTLTAAPFTLALEPSRQFFYGSPFTHLLGAYYQRQGITLGPSFVLVFGSGLLLLVYAVCRALVERCGTDGWGDAALIFCTSPLLLILVSWIGKDDAFLLAFYVLMLLSRFPTTRVILCALMILCHRELGAAMLLAHVLVSGEGMAVAAGAAAGLGLSFFYTNSLLDVAPQTRLDFMIGHASGLLASVLAHPFVHFIAALGPFWLYVLQPRSLNVRRIAVLAMAAVLASMSLDFTRIFVLVSAPLAIALTEEIVKEVREHGGVAILGARMPVAALGLLAFAQLQLAGDRLSWWRDFTWVIS